ncbi:uncharacterized protein LOC123301504 [Chrysoperla carnea]|uniref:uncharacterized protein LOC123301504 n=1 Tax=Chrysoperla carnea TaxID=189513 RepID=UPI001D08C784|nr:uncharacterized protein LOC123301504 [Chrysoperla carnea]
MRFLSLLCFVGCTLFVNSESVEDLQNLILNGVLKNRNNFANGFGGKLPSLDPLQIDDSFSVNANTIIELKDTIQHATFKGLTSFDQASLHLNTINSTFSFKLHIPKIEFSGDFNHDPVVLNVSNGSFSSTLNDVELNIIGDFNFVTYKHQNGKRQIPEFSNLRVLFEFGGLTTNIKIQAENISENYVQLFIPLLTTDMGPLLQQASETYQTEISQFVTNYLNEMHRIKA